MKLSKESELSEIIFTLMNKNGFGLIDSEALRKAILKDSFLYHSEGLSPPKIPEVYTLGIRPINHDLGSLNVEST